MNVVFVCHGGLTSQSTYHVLSIAEQLTLLGHHCLICTPQRSTDDAVKIRPTNVPLQDFDQALNNDLLFPDRKGPTLIHCWTPREQVRKFTENLSRRHGCPYFVHLEDNERELLNRELENISYEDLANLPPEEQSAHIPYPEIRIHPHKHWQFLRRSAGCTVLMDRLKEHVPTDTPVQLFWPGPDACFSGQSEKSPTQLRVQYGISPEQFVVLYAGAFHGINYDDISCMVTALKILANRGMPVCFVKTGSNDFPELLKRGIAGGWIKDLGFLPREQLPTLYSLSDVMIQPGQCDVFNEYRFPSKLPEALAQKLPIILPPCNLGLVLRDMVEALIIEDSSMESLMEKIVYLHDNPDIRVRIGENGRRFCLEHLSWEKSSRVIEAFYAACLSETRAELSARGLVQAEATDYRTVTSRPSSKLRSSKLSAPITPKDLHFLYQEEHELEGKGTVLANSEILRMLNLAKVLGMHSRSQKKKRKYKLLCLLELIIILSLLYALYL